MEQDLNIQQITASIPPGHHNNRPSETIERTIEISDTTLHLCIQTNNEPVPLSDMVPLAQAISDKLVSILIEQAAQTGRPVQCRNGCCACCRYLVALSLPEVYAFRQVFSSIDIERRIPILHAGINASKQILDSSLREKSGIHDGSDMPAINQWYASLHLKCPFLSAGSCSIYEQRPLACREHIVITSPAFCDSRQNQSPEIVNVPVSMAEVLGELAADLHGSAVEAVILPLALTCMDLYVTQAHRTWPAVEMLTRFLHILETAAVISNESLTAAR
jgi:Fe-S-cluster containining protein